MESGSDQLLNDLTLKCTAGRTRIATPSGEKAIEYLDKGESVLAFSSKVESGRIELSSSETKVTFSGGTQGRSNALYITLGYKQEIICTLDQPFLLINGKYTTGSQLRPGTELVDEKGDPVVVSSISMGTYQGMINNISVGDFNFTSPDGHLLLAQGVIIGDFVFQLFFDSLPGNLKE
ncbi:hypothetical protein LPB248_04210 [Flavobacterium sp. LPB0248]|uniref:polymorphic toxin-type HINT domain-containing protein n=1 Tax=Flavobacterium sp. LPB0248 TaxID=2614441 RepID=UPI0015A5C108|nr:polymorphic toxin-type HINT domain-containing protein [Flavobacterium sp. LPB0248]QLC65521.1 hypothetical protein LPB248_04210 [Flavobacterium sp. LPB0248]